MVKNGNVIVAIEKLLKLIERVRAFTQYDRGSFEVQFQRLMMSKLDILFPIDCIHREYTNKTNDAKIDFFISYQNKKFFIEAKVNRTADFALETIKSKYSS